MTSKHAADGGRVAAIWRYPVKSMGGEPLDETAIDARGLAGDRSRAVVDAETGYVASAKHPRKWGGLLACRAAYISEPAPEKPLPAVQLALPDGSLLLSDAPDVDERISGLVGRRVRLQEGSVGSSRVDLQACKLEYSIVSPK